MSVRDLQPADLVGRKFELLPVDELNLRISVYEPPRADHQYVIGYDAAYGIMGRDYDAACIMDKNSYPVRQVGEIQGWVGEVFDRILYAAAVYWNGAFIVGERQVGLPVLRRLWNDFDYQYLYFEKSEETRVRRLTDRFGHARVHDDVTMRDFRMAVRERQILIRSRILAQQMRKVQWREPVSKVSDNDERREDEELKIKLAGGGSPDLVMAAVYAWLGIREVGKFEKPKDESERALDAWLGHKEEPSKGLLRH